MIIVLLPRQRSSQCSIDQTSRKCLGWNGIRLKIKLQVFKAKRKQCPVLLLSYMQRRQYTNVMPNDFTISILVATRGNVARHYPRFRGHEDGNDAKRLSSNKACTAKMDWPYYKNLFPKSGNNFLCTELQRKPLRWQKKQHLQLVAKICFNSQQRTQVHINTYY